MYEKQSNHENFYKKKGARGDRRRPRGQAAGRGGGEGGSTEARYIRE